MSEGAEEAPVDAGGEGAGAENPAGADGDAVNIWASRDTLEASHIDLLARLQTGSGLIKISGNGKPVKVGALGLHATCTFLLNAWRFVLLCSVTCF
jgi:hypothetical protein